MRKVLITSAGGRISRAFRGHIGAQYDMRLAEIDVDKIVDAGDHEVEQADMSDLDACRRICASVDTVVHLAANSSPRADFHTSLLDHTTGVRGGPHD